MKRTPGEWAAWYVAHGGHEDLELDDREIVLFHPDHGFVTFLTHDDILELHHACGDGMYWRDALAKIMKAHGLKRLRAFTRRNPKAWMRKYGGRIRGYYMEADIDELIKNPSPPDPLSPKGRGGAPSGPAGCLPQRGRLGWKRDAIEKDVISGEV